MSVVYTTIDERSCRAHYMMHAYCNACGYYVCSSVCIMYNMCGRACDGRDGARHTKSVHQNANVTRKSTCHNLVAQARMRRPREKRSHTRAYVFLVHITVCAVYTPAGGGRDKCTHVDVRFLRERLLVLPQAQLFHTSIRAHISSPAVQQRPALRITNIRPYPGGKGHR